MADRVAIVTGGGSGIGAATARRLAELDVRVAVVDENAGAAEAVAASLPDAISIVASASREEDIERYTRETLWRFGRVDFVHLAATMSRRYESLWQLSTDDFDRVIAANLRSVFIGLRTALWTFFDQGEGGAIVATVALGGLSAPDGDAPVPYTAAKHGVIGLVKSAAAYGARLGVRVNAIAPGADDRELSDDLRDAFGEGAEERLRALRSAAATRRTGAVEEAGALVALLFDDDASDVTGAVIPVEAAPVSAVDARA